VIFKDSNIIANWKEYTRDRIDAKLSMYRGPNRIIWYSYEPHENFMIKHLPDDIYQIKFLVEGKETLSYRCNIRSIVYNPALGCIEVLFVPVLYDIVDSFSYDFNLNVNTIEEFLTAAISPHKCMIAESLKNVTLFNQFNVRGRLIDLICKIAADLEPTEVFVGDEALVFGKLLANPDIFPVQYHLQEENVHSVTRNWVKEITCVETTECFLSPGTVVEFRNNKRRIIYSHYRWGPDPYQIMTNGKLVNSCTINYILTDDTTGLSEIQYADLLPYEDREKLMQRIATTSLSIPSMFGHIDRGDSSPTFDVGPNTHIVNTNLIDLNPDKINITDPFFNKTVTATPYCGMTRDLNYTGIIYPKLDRMYEVILNMYGYYASNVTVANLWNTNDKLGLAINEDNDLDYRFDLPGNSSEYHHSILNSDWTLDGDKPYIKYNQYTRAVHGSMDIGYISAPDPTKIPVVDGGGFSNIIDENTGDLSVVKLWTKEDDNGTYKNEMRLSFEIAKYYDTLDKNTIFLTNENGGISIESQGGTDVATITITGDGISLSYGTTTLTITADTVEIDSATTYKILGNLEVTGTTTLGGTVDINSDVTISGTTTHGV